jgi:probable F420-dependent oxidoreductase
VSGPPQFTLALPMLPASHYLPLARRAEEQGFTNIAVPDSVFYPEEVSAAYPYTPDGARFWDADTPFLDPFVAIPAMAAVTERIGFFTNVLKLAIREPLLVAKAVSSMAALSDGRVALGVGLSWIPEEFEWLGQRKATRGVRTDEAIRIIRGSVEGEWFEFHGDHYDFDRLKIRPGAPGPVPIYVGGTSEAGLRRAAELGDGWISVVIGTDELRDITGRLRELRAAAGRSDLPFEIKVISGDTFDLDGYRRLVDLGVTDLMVCPWYFYGGDPHSLDTQLEGIDRFTEDVIATW